MLLLPQQRITQAAPPPPPRCLSGVVLSQRHQRQRQQRQRCVCVAARTGGGSTGDDPLAAQFAQHVNAIGAKLPQHRRIPSPLDPPTAAVTAQLDALQRVDWPTAGAGVGVALAFAKPQAVEQLRRAVVPQLDEDDDDGEEVGEEENGSGPSSSSSSSSPSQQLQQQPAPPRVRSWGAREAFCTPREFAAQLRAPPFDVLLACDSWRLKGPPVFPPSRGPTLRAVQVVEVVAAAATAPASSSSSSSGSSGGDATATQQQQRAARDAGVPAASPERLRSFTFSFCLERIDEGAYKGCWLTCGVRQGDYST